MKNMKTFFKIVENQNGDIFWNGIKIEKLGETKIQIEDGEEEYDFNESIQDGILYENILKDLNDEDTLTLKNIMETFIFSQNKHAPASFKSENMRYIRDILPGRVLLFETGTLEGDEMKIYIFSNNIDMHNRLEVLTGLKRSGHTDT